MSQFKQNLQGLPAIDHLKSLEVKSANTSEPVLIIENKPGKSGSLAVYYYLKSEFGALTVDAATRGLGLFAEYANEARLKPGSHPNIDFLLALIENDEEYEVLVNRAE